MSDPRFPAAFQRPGGRPAADADAAPAPAAPPTPAAPARRPRASARPELPAEPVARGGNRIVLLGADEEALDGEAPPPRRNLALGGLYGLAAALLALALLGGLWSQDYLRGVQIIWNGSVNPDGLQELDYGGAEAVSVGISRLLVQLAPTTLALGVLALLVAIVLPVLTRRPR